MSAIPPRFDDMDPAQIRAMADDARAAAEAAPGVREVLEPVADAAEARLEERPVSAIMLPERLEADPQDVIVDQREAMARAVVMRDDESRPAAERQVWGEVVERLARARRAAKEAMAELRRADPDLQTYGVLIAARQAAERADDDFTDTEIRDDPGRAAGAGSGRGEPAPWSHRTAYPDDPAQRAEPSDTALTDKLVEGIGYAGGTGGQAGENLPADTGLAPGSPRRPSKDPEPPDVAHH